MKRTSTNAPYALMLLYLLFKLPPEGVIEWMLWGGIGLCIIADMLGTVAEWGVNRIAERGGLR